MLIMSSLKFNPDNLYVCCERRPFKVNVLCLESITEVMAPYKCLLFYLTIRIHSKSKIS